MDLTKGYIMADGNTAAALGAIYGGVQFVAWYPITPASSLAEELNEYLPRLRKDPIEEGKNTFAVVQAEDELAAIGMTIGAGWSGLRAMTSTSGPGLSLMAEYAGLAYFARCRLWSGMYSGSVQAPVYPPAPPKAISVLRLLWVMAITQHIVLLPGSVSECFEFGWRAFDIAERMQSPVFVLSDLDFGMNQWMTKPFEYPDRPMDRGKVLWEADLEKLGGVWGRYQDVDGDNIPYRTVPGNRHPAAAYFARGTGHDEFARYTEDNLVWYNLLERLKRKYETARQYVPKPEVVTTPGAKIGVIFFGSTEPAIHEARFELAKTGLAIDTCACALSHLPLRSKILSGSMNAATLSK